MKTNTWAYVLIISSLIIWSCQQKHKEAASEQETVAIKTGAKPNILFIAVDDLRPELNCYGQTHIISPNIDAIADQGIVFKNAYVTVPVCGASRASLLTGIHPTPSRFIDYGSRVDKEAAGITTLPEHFKNNGYYTTSVGKIFHHPDDGLASWSDQPVRPDYPNTLAQQELWRDYQSEENAYTKKDKLPLGAAGPAFEAADVADNVYYDGKTADLALKKIEKLAGQEQPFFLGVGFIRPHLPFNAPKKYWDLYDPEKIRLATNDSMPDHAPQESWHNYGELRSYTNIPNDTLPIRDEKALQLRHGYYASVSFIDAQIGKIIDKLKALGLYENTHIVLWGDHGWSLGEHTLWCKQSCFTQANHAPLIVKRAGDTKGKSTKSLVSFIDIYPTLCELSGLPKPIHTSGESFVSVLDDPQQEINEYIFWRWQNGETVKSPDFMLTRYTNEIGDKVSYMLYDHNADFEESENIIEKPEYKQAAQQMISALDGHIKTRDD